MAPLAAVLLLPAASPALAGSVETAVIAETLSTVDTAWDRPGEDRATQSTWLDAQARGRTETGHWQLGVWGHHAVRVGRDTEALWELEVGESGWEGELGPVGLRVGHLVERWGNLDLLSSLDLLNGRDLRDGPLTPLRRMRVPAPLVRAQLGGARVRGELTLLPFGARDRVGLWGTDLSLVRQGMATGLAAEAATWPGGDALSEDLAQQLAGALRDGLATLDAQTRMGAESALAQAGSPRPLDETLDVGARLEATLGRVDAAVVGAWIRSRQPLPTADPALVAVLRRETLPGIADQDTLLAAADQGFATRWPRTAVGGLELGTVLGTVGLRSETAVWSHRALTQAWLQGTTRPQLSQGLALDRAWGTWLSLSVEGRYSHLFNAPDNALMVGIPDTWELGVAGRADLARGHLGLELGGLANLSFREASLRPGLSWRVSDAVELGAGALVFVAPGDAATGWRDAFTWAGGPLGYASDADAAWVRAKWIH